MSSTKVSRRDAIKVITAVGAALAVTPYVASANGRELATQADNSSEANRTIASGDEEPLVVVVKNDELLAFRGQEEVRIRDGRIGVQLHQVFESNRKVM